MIVAALKEDVPQLIARGYRDLGPSKLPSFRLLAWVGFDAAPRLDEERAHLNVAVAALGDDT